MDPQQNLEGKLQGLQDQVQNLQTQVRVLHDTYAFLLALGAIRPVQAKDSAYEVAARTISERLQHYLHCEAFLLLNQPGSKDPAQLACYGPTPKHDLTALQLESRLMQGPKAEYTITAEGKPFGQVKLVKDLSDETKPDVFYARLFMNKAADGIAQALVLAHAFQVQREYIDILSTKLMAKSTDVRIERQFKISQILPTYFQKDSGMALLDRYVTKARAEASDLSLMFIDIDNFHDYNETYKHLQGDEAITAIGKDAFAHVRHAPLELYAKPAVIGRNLQKSPKDFGIHFGGDEACLVLYGAGKDKAAEIAERIKQSITHIPLTLSPENPAPHATYGPEQLPYNRVTVSIGIDSLGKDDNKTAKQLLGNADTAMYWAKQHGRNRHAVYDASMVSTKRFK